jgi:hypothetical protein
MSMHAGGGWRAENHSSHRVIWEQTNGYYYRECRALKLAGACRITVKATRAVIDKG